MKRRGEDLRTIRIQNKVFDACLSDQFHQVGHQIKLVNGNINTGGNEVVG